MRCVGRVVFVCCAVLLWVAACVLVLEAYSVFKWQRIERTNPFVRARLDGLPWPTGQDLTNPPGWEAVLAEEPTAPALEAEPGPRAEMQRRAALFASLPEEDRSAFATAYGMLVLIADGEGSVLACHPGRLGTPTELSMADVRGPERAREEVEAIRRVLRTGEAEFGLAVSASAPEPFFLPLTPPPGEASRAYVFIPSEPVADWGLGDDNQWERPFFIYRKHVTFGDGRLRTNNFGFRDDDVVVPKPEGVFRIVCVGGSTTEEGDTNAVTYPNLLERKLNARFPGHVFDVVNCGVTGINSLKEKLRMPGYLALEPDLIVYYNGVNDICHELFPRWVADTGPWRRLARRLKFLNEHCNRWLLPSAGEMGAALDGLTFRNLAFMAEYARSHNTDFAICSFCAPDIANLDKVDRAYYEYYNRLEWGGRYVTFETYCRVLAMFNEKVRLLCEKMGLLYVPVAEGVRGGTYCFGDICHMKNAGIELKASVVLEHLVPYLAKRGIVDG